jgi:AP endonuclease-1
MCPEAKRARLHTTPSIPSDPPSNPDKMNESVIAIGQRYIGAHVSGAGGLFNAFVNTRKIGGSAMALFLKNQRKWSSSPLGEPDISKFKEFQARLGVKSDMILPHGSYLINLGNPDSSVWQKSYDSFVDDVRRCQQLGIRLYNFHPGSTVGKCSVKESIALIASGINAVHKEVPDVCIVLETMAGQGHTIGNKFEDLRHIIDKVQNKSRVGICIDTCHIFSAGYDIRSKAAYTKTMDKFGEIVGFEYLKGVHLNDSKTDLGSGKDRHENIGRGKIGIEAFRHLINDPRFTNIPMVLETPLGEGANGESIYRREIELLYSLLDQSSK